MAILGGWTSKARIQRLHGGAHGSGIISQQLRQSLSLTIAITTKQKVWCLVIDQEKQAIGHPFNVEENMGELRKKVKEKMKADLEGFTANSLIVWQCKERKLLSTNGKEEINLFLENIDFCEEREVVGLTSGRKLKDLELGDEEVVLVQLPGAYKKQKLEEKDPLISFYKNRNADLEAAHDPPAPSSAAASPRLSQEQSNRPVLNGQPLRLHAEPIGLFYPVFNQFQADLNNTERFIGDVMTYDQVEMFFFAFANISALDNERVEGIEEVMEGLLDREFTVMKKQEVPSDRVMIQSCGESKTYLVIQDVKYEFGIPDPHIQAGLTYQKYRARQESLIRRCCCPSIILSIAGPWMCVIGGVYIGKVIIQPLTNYMWLGGDPYDPKRQVFAGRLFTALKSAISTLADYYKTLEPKSGVPPSIGNPYPFITEYGARKTKFTYLCRLAAVEYPHKLLYKARLDDTPDTQIVIKFVERYNAVAHRQFG